MSPENRKYYSLVKCIYCPWISKTCLWQNSLQWRWFEMPSFWKVVETYLQILASAYRVSLGFQKNSSSIADVIPSILKLQSVWETLNLSPTPRRFCNLLILTTQLKFDYELSSDVYMVSFTFKNIILYSIYH